MVALCRFYVSFAIILRNNRPVNAEGEAFDEAVDAGYEAEPGQLGEGVTTRGIDRLAQTANARACRTHASKINGFEPGRLREVIDCADDAFVERKGSVMVVGVQQ